MRRGYARNRIRRRFDWTLRPLQLLMSMKDAYLEITELTALVVRLHGI